MCLPFDEISFFLVDHCLSLRKYFVCLLRRLEITEQINIIVNYRQMHRVNNDEIMASYTSTFQFFIHFVRQSFSENHSYPTQFHFSSSYT